MKSQMDLQLTATLNDNPFKNKLELLFSSSLDLFY